MKVKKVKMTTLFDEPTENGPLQWIGFDENLDKYHVYPKAIKYLQSLTRPLSIISVVGLYRTGKSYLLNRILDVPKGQSFQVSPTIKSCTKGLWIMRPAIAMEDHDILVVDTEGLGSLSATTNHDTRVFSLALLLSSMFLYNATGAINETSLNNLSLVSSIAKHIHVTSEYETNNNELSSCFPRFMWVARDFSLQIVDDDNNPTDATTYFNTALKVSPNSNPDEAKNKVRNAINSLFPIHKRDCVTMPRPCESESKLQNLPDLSDNELRPEFLNALKTLKEIIFKKCMPLSVPGQEGLIITGPLLSNLCQTYVDAINSNKVPVIQDSWSLLSAAECSKAAENARHEWRNFTQELDHSLSVKEVYALLESKTTNILQTYDQNAVGTSAKDLRLTLQEEMITSQKIVLESAKMRAKERMRDRLQKLQKRAMRDASSVGDLIKIFEDDVDNEEEPQNWYPEAFPCLIRAVEMFTNQTEKKMLELQRQVDSADLEIANIKTSASTRVKEAEEETKKIMEEKQFIEENLDATLRQLSDAKRRAEENERQFSHSQEEFAHTKEEMRKRIQELESRPSENSETIVNEEDAKRISEMTQQLIERDSELEHLKEEFTKVKKDAESKSKETQELLNEIALLTPLKIEVEEYKSKCDEMSIALQSNENRMEEMEHRHEEESQTIQKEAMETVTAIRSVLAKERERCKKQQEQSEKTLIDVREKALIHAKELEGRADRAEELAHQRQNAMDEAKRLASKERDALRAEIDRYANLFKEQQESSTLHRKEWMSQLQETQKIANDRERKLMEEKERIRRESDDIRRTLEMEATTAKAQLTAMERRRASIEQEMIKMRERLGKSESSQGTAVRLRAELSMAKEQKDRAQSESRTLSARITMLERKIKETRRQCEMEKTKISMQYERQISVLESKIL